MKTPRIKYYYKGLPARIYFESRENKWYMYLYKLYLYILKPKIKEGYTIIPPQYLWEV